MKTGAAQEAVDDAIVIDRVADSLANLLVQQRPGACAAVIGGFVVGSLLAIFLLPSPWGLIVVAVALVIDVLEVSVGLWYSRRRRATVGTGRRLQVASLGLLRAWRARLANGR